MGPNQQTPATQQAKDKASEMADKAQASAGQVVQQAQDTARNTLNGQMNRAAQSLGDVSHALRQTQQQLNDQNQGSLGRFAGGAADRLDQFSHDLQNKSVDDVIHDVENLARREPQLFLGGAAILGLVAARFLKSSQRSQQRFSTPDYSRSYSSGYQGVQQQGGYAERGPAGYPAGEGYRQGFSQPTQDTGYRAGTSSETGQRTVTPSRSNPQTSGPLPPVGGASPYRRPEDAEGDE